MNTVMNESWDLVIADELFAVPSYALAMKAHSRGRPFVTLSTCIPTNLMKYHLALGTPFSLRPSMYHRIAIPFDIEQFADRLHSVLRETYQAVRTQYVTGHVAVQVCHPTVTSSSIGNYSKECGKETDFCYNATAEVASFSTLQKAGCNTLICQYSMNECIEKNITGIPVTFCCCNGTDYCNKREQTCFSVKDTICGAVPVVYIPLFAEQSHNGEVARAAGFAEVLLKSSLTADLIERAVRKVSETPRYKKSVVRIKTYYLDRIIPSLDLAEFYIRRALKSSPRPPVFKRKGMYISVFCHTFCEYIFISLLLLFMICR
ncbi:hypothetical protein GCK32_016015 [Trichostrongylus colubriformis]|uniref:Uncharacterized protein n=1 Tax=Trichostrongylus colubriformis TaxID=6319 RepID=A0AAN8FKF4_TRICO